ncbi:MAG: PhzF family phenazine biosynthesis protein [Actinomycetota bacterium]
MRLVQVDAFTDTPFAGNPAAIALGDGSLDGSTMQAIAAEMNLSETAFPVRRSDGDWDLRWFTPAAEVDLCGHATLATAHLLFSDGLDTSDSITFHTRSGPLICTQSEAGIAMDFPAAPAAASGPIDGLAEALGVAVANQGVAFDIVAEVDSPATVAALAPNLTALAQIETRAVIVTAAGDLDGGPADFVSRVFGPRVGIPEDPVTGSAHCITGPWWAERLGRTDLAAHQVSPRGGRLGVRIDGDRVVLTGQAVTVLDGTLRI